MRTILIAALLFFPAIASAEETVPIPQKRPKVLSVSPEYIEQLKNRDQVKITAPIAEMFIDLTYPEALANIEPASGVETYEKNIELASIPIPGYKPKKPKTKTAERLVSFSLPPQEIDLNLNLETFLKTHALDWFKQNSNLKLDIQAYATTPENTQSSNTRIALARALEVRKFLLANNIEPSRLKLTPIGQDQNNAPNDRIDLVFIDISEEKY